jgi:hypothetical protein
VPQGFLEEVTSEKGVGREVLGRDITKVWRQKRGDIWGSERFQQEIK